MVVLVDSFNIMNSEVFFEKLKQQVKTFLEKDWSWHDYRHAERVFVNACKLQQQEWWDLLVIGSAALVHDMCRPREKQTWKSHFWDEALVIIRWVLESIIWYTDDQIRSILNIVSLHDIYDRSNPTDKNIELKVVQDADNLDAIWALWIARTFAFWWSHGLSIYIPWEDLSYEEDFEEIPWKYTTTISHFYEKLLKISKHMNTLYGKELAKQRHQFMEVFLSKFFDERNGLS